MIEKSTFTDINQYIFKYIEYWLLSVNIGLYYLYGLILANIGLLNFLL